MIPKLRELWDSGVRVLDIYWLQDNQLGDERWWCDVINDAMCEATDALWLWTVTNMEACLGADDECDHGVVFDDVLVEGTTYSDEVVKNAIVGWLHERNLMFDVRVINSSGTIGERRMLEQVNK